MKTSLTASEIKEIQAELNLSANEIEKKLGIGQGTLSKAISGTRELPAKWVQPLIALQKKSIKSRTGEVKPSEEGKLPAPSFDFLAACEELGKTPNEVLALIKSLSSAAPAELPDGPANESPIDSKFERLHPEQIVPEWIARMDEFCNEYNTTPDDVMNWYAGKKIEVKKPDGELTSLLSAPGKRTETYFEKRQRESRGEK